VRRHLGGREGVTHNDTFQI